MRGQSLRILLINHNRHGRSARRTVLEEQGYKVTTAAGGREGLDEFAAQSFDLVITDYKMPEVSGQQVIRKIRQQSPQTPIVLLSGFVEPLGLTEQSTGADVVLSKGPREVPELLRAIARLAQRRPAARPPGKAPAPKTAAARRRA